MATFHRFTTHGQYRTTLRAELSIVLLSRREACGMGCFLMTPCPSVPPLLLHAGVTPHLIRELSSEATNMMRPHML